MNKKLVYSIVGGLLVAILAGGYFYWLKTRPVEVGERVVTNEDVKELSGKYKKALEFAEDPQAAENAEAVTREMLVEEAIILHEAEKRGITATEQEIEERYQAIVSQYASEEEYKQVIEQTYGWTPELTKRTIKKDILRQKFLPHVLDHRWGRLINIQFSSGGGTLYEEHPKVYEDNAGVWADEIEAYSRTKGFGAMYSLFYNQTFDSIFEREFPAEYSEWDSYTNVAVAGEFEYSEDPRSSFYPGISQEELNAVFSLKEGETTPFIKSTDGGYHAMYILDKAGEGRYDSWEEFIEAYKKENNLSRIPGFVQKVFVEFLGFENSVFAQCAGCKGTRIYGKITDANTGAGISGAYVETFNNGSHSGWCGPGYGDTSANSSGDYNFSRVDGSGCFVNCGSGNSWSLRASKSGYYQNSRSYWPINGSSVRVSLALTPKVTNELVVQSFIDGETRNGAQIKVVSGSSENHVYTTHTFAKSSNLGITLEAPDTHNGARFVRWSGCDSTNGRRCRKSVSGSDKRYVSARYTNCDPEYELVCHNGNVHWKDSCGNMGNMYEACYGDLVCDAGKCIDPCAPQHHTYQCVDVDRDGDGDDIYWFNKCGERNDKKQFCGVERDEGAWNKTCYNHDLYNQRKVVVNGCSLRQDVCTSNTITERELIEDCVYDCFDKQCWIPEIDVSMDIEPQSGEEPLHTDITVDITINRPWSGWGASSFHIWWNCGSDTTNVAAAESECGALPATPSGTCASNSNGYRCVDINRDHLEIEHIYFGEGDNDRTCNPPDTPSKIYSTKVIAEKHPAPENASAAETVKVDPLIIPDCLPDPKGHSDIEEGEGPKALVESIADIIWVIIIISTPIAIALYIFAGVRLMFAGGNVNSVVLSKKIFIYTTLGYGIILLGWVLTYTIWR